MQISLTYSVSLHFRTMTAICFVCNLPILSHQVGLVWQGGNGWDDLVREQVEESTIRQRLGGRRDSATQICSISPPTEIQETSPPTSGGARRRRSSLAQLTDILREWGGGTAKARNKAPLCRRETLADLARSLPWGRQSTTDASGPPTTVSSMRKRRESSADSGIKSISSKSRRDSHTTAISDFRSEVAKLWQRRESTTVIVANTDRRRGSGESSRSGRRDSTTQGTSRRGSGESGRSSRRDSTTIATPPPKIVATHKKRRDSRTIKDTPYYRQEQRPSTSSTASDSIPVIAPSIAQITVHTSSDSSTQALPPPTIIMSSVTPPATSPTVPSTQATTPTHPLVATRRDSTTQCGHRLNRRDSRSHASPERATSKLSRLQRQNTAYDESCLPPGVWGRRESQPTLSPDVDDSGRKARRDSLSPDSASRSRRDSRTHLSPDRSAERDVSPVRHTRRGRLRRQSTSITGRGPGPVRSPDSSSCSSRDPSPCARPVPAAPEQHRPAIRRQSTTEEILIARGFRRQSTTEEMIRCRNFRRQSSQSDDTSRYRGRRDSCAQITDGTIGTMTVETTSTFFDSSTQTGRCCIVHYR